MAKHRQVNFRAKTARQFGLKWDLEGERLTRSLTHTTPRLACVAKRFESRGLELDLGAAQISIPHVAKVRQHRKNYLAALAFLPVLLVPMNVADEPEQVTTRARSCEINLGEQLPSKAEVTRKVTLGGLSVLTAVCNGRSYSVTVDAKGVIVGSKTL